MRKFLFAAVVPLLLFSTQAFGQSSNASVSGTVADASGAVIPGVTVSATNAGTGVVRSVVSNDAGVYNFASLQPGVYKLSAEQPGFQTQTYTDVQLGNAAQVRLNFTLQVAGVATQVEVSVAAERVLLESSSSVGDALPQRVVQELPSVNRNVLDMVKVMGGAIITHDAIFQANQTTFAGISAANINVQRDGIAVNDVRYPTGINSPTRLNPDLVGEVRMILAPVDAEVGRGNGQVQVQTRAGSNAYHGSLVWNAQNSALDSNLWLNNRSAVAPPWRNLQQYTLSLGGPIVKNKTFFFALYDGQIARHRVAINRLSLTPCAQRGIFRFYDNWNNGNIFTPTVATGTTPTIPVVDAGGNPMAPASNPNGTPHNGILRYASVFGRLQNTPTRADCSDAVVQGPAWDTYRTRMDPTGFVGSFLKMMPAVNNYEVGDGLNTAGHRWNRTLRGADNLYQVGEDTQRKQINIRIDHHFNERHRIHGSWSFERRWADDSFRNWPDFDLGGRNEGQPQVLTANFTSTLSPTLLNEARFGLSRTGTNVYSPLDNPVSGAELAKLLPEVNGVRVITGLGTGGVNFNIAPSPAAGVAAPPGTPSHFYGTRGILPVTFRDTSPRWTFGDTLSWTRGKHAFKGGAEVRLTSSLNITEGDWGAGNTIPYANGGNAPLAPVAGMTSANMGLPGLTGTQTSGNRMTMENLLTFLSGSIGNVQQYYFINSPDKVTSWNDFRTEQERIRDFQQKEFALFFKDDWKVHQDLTLNLGLRYEYYGVPYIKSGLTVALKGGSSSLFGISGRSFSDWMKAGTRADQTELVFVGPNSPNTDLRVYDRDLNNFGPAVGFAWQVPWFGRGKTTVRGGYQVSYLGGGRASVITPIIGQPPGSVYTANYTGDSVNTYIDLSRLSAAVPAPIPAGVVPMRPIPVTERTQSITAFDPNYVSPYVQNLTLAVTRNLRSNLTVDVRYVGTLSRKLFGTININLPNFMHNGLLEAFNAAREGGESALLDAIFKGVNIAGSGYGPVGTTFNGVPQTGALHLRAATTGSIRNNLANGNYSALANTLNNLNYATAMNPTLPVIPTGVNGAVLRLNGFPENFIKTNPQFNNATFETNVGYANYHSLQAQFTLRPTHGLSFQATYTWSKNLGIPTASGSFTDPANRAADYALLGTHRTHAFVTYGTFDLPFGPRRLLFGNSSGILARFVEGWQGSWIVNINSGTPANISAANMLYGNGVPDLAGPFSFDTVGVKWDHGALAGNYFGDAFIKVPDPQCANIAASLRALNLCTLQAIADAKTGQIIFQNPLPGKRGNFGQNRLFGPVLWSADMAVSKRVQIGESKSVQIRVDATNIFNHPIAGGGQGASGERIRFPTLPDMSINSTNPFGYLGAKVGSRVFQLMARFDF